MTAVADHCGHASPCACVNAPEPADLPRYILPCDGPDVGPAGARLTGQRGPMPTPRHVEKPRLCSAGHRVCKGCGCCAECRPPDPPCFGCSKCRCKDIATEPWEAS